MVNVYKTMSCKCNLFNFFNLVDSLTEAQQALLDSTKSFELYLTKEITDQCAVQLRNVSDIPRLYRKTNRDVCISYVYLMFHLVDLLLK